MTTKSRLVCFCAVLIALLATPATWAQPASKFDLPSQSLAASLRAVGTQASVNVLFDPPLVEGLQAPALTAAMTTDQAFAQLLAGTKLKYRYLDSKTVMVISAVDTTQNANAIRDPEPAEKTTRGRTASSESEETKLKDMMIEEIVVTAQKRSSFLEKTPISITAVSGEDMQNRGITNFSTLAAATPGISMKTNGPGQTEFEMRGVTSSGGNSPTVGFYLDDIPMTSPAAAQNGKVVIDPTLYDLNRVEVLRGPQGTLYGSGSMGGTIRLITNQPDLSEFQGSAEAILSGTDGGGFNHNENVMLNLPLIDDRMALRIVASHADTSGWVDRIVLGDFPPPTNGGLTRGNVLAAPVLENNKGSNAEQLAGTRVTLAWKPIDNLTITPSIFYQRITQDGPSAFDSDPGTMAHYQPFSIAEPYSDSITVSSLTVNYKFESFDITSITSNWNRISRQTQDGSENFENGLDAFPNTRVFYGSNGTGPISGTEVDPSHQFSEELRAASSGDGRLSWVAGLFYSNFKSNWELFTRVPNPPAFFQTINDVWILYQPTNIKQSAAFGEATYAITDQLKLTGGLRVYKYQNDIDNSFAGFGEPSGTDTPTQTSLEQSASGSNPKINLSYEPGEHTLLYATAAKGFRPGGGNQPLPISGPPGSVGPGCIEPGLVALGYPAGKPAPSTYGPDSLWSYELGEKAQFFNNRLRINSSVFYEIWKQIQLEELPCNYPLFDNANSAHIYGGELEIEALLTTGLTLSASTGYTHATLAESSHGFTAGDRVPDVPTWTGDINLKYYTPINEKYAFNALAENVYTGGRVDLSFPGGVSDTQTPLPGYDLTNMRAGITSSDGWGASLFADNVFNKHASLENMVELTLANASYNRVSTNQPLTIGVDLSYHFR
jgi:iron complex outermembrane receptor protein